MRKRGMHPRTYPLTVVGSLASLLLALFPAIGRGDETEQVSRPHIVVFLSDDHTWRDSSVYGSPDIQTPNMQRLANAGMTLNNAFVASPSCAPSRAALLTGLFPARNGAEPNHSKPRPDLKKLPAYLQELGYEVVSFGKVGHYAQTPEYGFDVARHFKYHEDVAVDEAITWLRQRQSGKPLCLFVGTNWPHVPWPKDDKTIDLEELVVPPNHVDTPTSRNWRTRYVAAIRTMDHELGKVYDAAREVLGNDVFFLHTSDHGAQWPFGKWNLYDDGIRTPMIVSWPGKIAGGTRSDALVSWIDVLPTLVEVAGEAAPSNIDGMSFLPVLTGNTAQHRDAIFTTHSGDGNFNVFPIRAVSTADGWKYIRNLHPEFVFHSHVTKTQADNGYWLSWVDAAATDDKAKALVHRYQNRPAEELYNTQADPYEQTNRIADGDQQQRVADMRGRLEDWMKQTGDTQTVFGEPELVASADKPDHFVNPIAEGADPWVVRDPNAKRYLWCMSDGNRAIAIHASSSLTSMGKKQIVWRAPRRGPTSREIWAPELHFLDGRWYIYFAASDGKNENHLAYVLESKTDDPLGQYELHGPFATGEGESGASPNIWAIDMTVLQHDGKRYAIWSGWDQPGSDQQYLYIAPMASPTELAGPRVRLCDNDDYLWERVEPNESQRGLNEGPQVFQADGQTSVVFSCGASWLPTYKLGLLELTGADPLVPSSWKKRARPVFQGTEATYGVGHSCFVKSLDDRQWWHVFHAKRDRDPGWRRAVFVQPMRVGRRGFPQFGSPVAPGSHLRRPSGEEDASEPFSVDAFDYFGHHQFLAVDGPTIRLGKVPDDPINDYRSGEKVVFKGGVPSDFRVEVTIDFQGESQSRDAGLLLRTTAPSVGYDAQQGYFVGLIPRTQLVVLGRTDGAHWLELARAATSIDTTQPQKLAVEIRGNRIAIWHNGMSQMQHTDHTFDHGSVGLRVVDTDAIFSDVNVAAL